MWERFVASTINIAAYSDALVVLGTAGIVVPIVSRLGCQSDAGLSRRRRLLGPLGLGSFIRDVPMLYWFTVGDAKNVDGIAELGVVFLLFLIGLELSLPPPADDAAAGARSRRPAGAAHQRG